MQVGIEAFFYEVCNTPEYAMNPIWFFTSEVLMDYMPIAVPHNKPWYLAYVGAKIEAFAVTGCNPVSM